MFVTFCPSDVDIFLLWETERNLEQMLQQKVHYEPHITVQNIGKSTSLEGIYALGTEYVKLNKILP